MQSGPSDNDKARATADEVIRRVDEIVAKVDTVSRKIELVKQAISKSEFILIASQSDLRGHIENGHNLSSKCLELDNFDGYSYRYLRAIENIDSWLNRILFYCDYMETGEVESQDHT